MDVQCPQCQTLFEFDEKQLRGAQTTLKCGVCTYMFRVDTALSTQTESLGRWMVKSTARGDVLYFATFDQLHRWLMDGTVTPHDTLSRTGRAWITLSDMGELLPIFQALDSIKKLSPHALPALKLSPFAPPSPGAAPPVDRPRASTLQQFIPRHPDPSPPLSPAASKETWTLGGQESYGTSAPMPTESLLPYAPAPAAAPPAPHAEPDRALAGAPERPSRVGALVAALLVVGAIGAGAYVWFFRPDLLEPPKQTVVAAPPLAPAPAPVDPADEAYAAVGPGLGGGVRAALAQAEAENLRVWGGALEGTREEVEGAKEAAGVAAKKRAEKPDAESILRSAGRALRENDASRAHKLYHEVLDQDPRSPAALTGLGWALLGMGQVDAAGIQFERAIHTQASYGDAYIGLGKAERLKGNLKAALGAYENYLARFPSGGKASIARHQSHELRQTLGL